MVDALGNSPIDCIVYIKTATMVRGVKTLEEVLNNRPHETLVNIIKTRRNSLCIMTANTGSIPVLTANTIIKLL